MQIKKWLNNGWNKPGRMPQLTLPIEGEHVTGTYSLRLSNKSVTLPQGIVEWKLSKEDTQVLQEIASSFPKDSSAQELHTAAARQGHANSYSKLGDKLYAGSSLLKKTKTWRDSVSIKAASFVKLEYQFSGSMELIKRQPSPRLKHSRAGSTSANYLSGPCYAFRAKC